MSGAISRFIGLLAIALFAHTVQAIEFNNVRYEVYYYQDESALFHDEDNSYIYLHGGKKLFISLPLDPDALLILDPLPSVTSQIRMRMPKAYEYSKARFTDRKTPAELAQLKKLKENKSYFVGDFNGDGLEDILVKVQNDMPGLRDALVLFLGTKSNSETFTVSSVVNDSYIPNISEDIYDESFKSYVASSVEENSKNFGESIGFYRGHNLFSDNGLPGFVVKDYDGDGKDELVLQGDDTRADFLYHIDIDDNNKISVSYSESDEAKVQPATLNGASAGQFRVDERGAATYSLPLTLPEGTAGVAPDIALHYSSQGGDGYLGHGWSMSGLSSITRCRKTLAQDGMPEPLRWDQAVFCYNGQRLREVDRGSSYVDYRTEIDNFARIRAYGISASNPFYFKVEAKDGSISYFGSRLKNSQEQTLSWSISRFRDSIGNVIIYDYEDESGNNHRISRIYYAFGDADAEYGNEHSLVEFHYKDRPDVSTSYTSGFKLSLSKRLSKIIVKNKEPSNENSSGLQEIRTYNLGYRRGKVQDLHKRSYLTTVQECAGGECLPPTQFDWAISQSLEFSESSWVSDKVEKKSRRTQTLPLDIDGDGYLDMAWVETDEHDQKHAQQISYALYNPETRKFEEQEFLGTTQNCVDKHKQTEIEYCDEGDSGSRNFYLSAIDYNGDGRQDLALYRDNKDVWQIYLATNDGETWKLTADALPNVLEDVLEPSSTLIDINSDGMSDLITEDAVYFLEKDHQAEASSPTPYAFSEPQAIKWVGDFRSFNYDHEVIDRFKLTDEYGYEYKDWKETFTEKSIIHTGDFNGDGAVDLIIADRLNWRYARYRARSVFSVYENYYLMIQERSPQGDVQFRVRDFLGSSHWNPQKPLRHHYTPGLGVKIPSPYTILTADFNGDGLSDILMERKRDNSSPFIDKDAVSFDIHLNTGNGLLEPISFLTVDNRQDFDLQLADLTGDGYPDVVWKNNRGNAATVYYKAWDPAQSQLGETTFLRKTGDDSQERLMFYDATGDGHIDFLHFDGSRMKLYPNTQTGPVNVISNIVNGLGAKTTIDYGSLLNSPHYEKINNADGSAINEPFADASDQQSLASAYQVPVLEYLAPMQLVTRVESSSPSGSLIRDDVDLNATIAIDYYYKHARFQAAGRGFLGFAELATVDKQTGIKTVTEYRQDWPFIGYPKRTRTYGPVASSPGRTPLMSDKSTEWGLIGWDANWIDDLKTSTRGSTVLPLLKPYQYRTENISYLSKNLQYNPEHLYISGKQTITTENRYDDYGNVVYTETLNESDGMTLKKVVKNDYDNDGNFATQGTGPTLTLGRRDASYAELGRLTHTQIETTRNNATPTIRESHFTYYQDGHHVGLLESEIIEPNDSNVKLETVHTYDARGNKVRSEVTGRNHVFDFYGYGTVATTDQVRSESYEYDSVYRYIDISKVSLGEEEFVKEKVIARNAYGSPTLIKSGLNETETRLAYDLLGREIYRSDNADDINDDGIGAWSETEYLRCDWSLNCPPGTSYVVRKTASGGGEQLSYYDILAREIRSEKSFRSRSGSITYAVVDTVYDKLGRAIKVSEPYTRNNSVIYWTETTYDILGRAIKIKAPDGSIQQIWHNKLSTTFINANEVQRTETKNGLGELIAVKEGGVGATPYSTSIDYKAHTEYNYDNSGNLQFIRSYPDFDDPDNNNIVVTHLSYDKLGRKTRMNDPDKGIWDYQYNAFGELVWQRDAKGQVVTQVHDSLGRVTSRIEYESFWSYYHTELAFNTRWYYDGRTETSGSEKVIPNALLQVSAVVRRTGIAAGPCSSSALIQCSHPEYDRFGRPLGSQSTYGTAAGIQRYTSYTEYDELGRVDKTTDVLNGLVKSGSAHPFYGEDHNARYGDGTIVSGTQNHYDHQGLLYEVTDLQTGKALYTLEEMNARGQVEISRRGNGATSYNAYDPETGRLIVQYTAIGATYNIQNINYSWDSLGNLSHRQNRSIKLGSTLEQHSARNISERFCYDELNRLIKTRPGTLYSSPCSSLTVAQQDMRYDSRGNVLYKAGVGEYSYSEVSAGPHAVTATSDGYRYVYDKNGNLEYDELNGNLNRSFTYTTFDKPSKITKGDASNPDHITEFKYGIGDSRYWRKDTDKNGVVTETLYLGNVERITRSNNPGKIEWKRYLGKSAIISIVTDSQNTMLTDADSYKERYLYHDHLGSLDVITDTQGTVVQSMSFDPWGQRRNEDNWDNYDIRHLIGTSALAQFKENTTRGFTGHEMLDEVGIIHMNGRIYDPRISRFVQADPIVQAATHAQSLNRYSYTWNNPLNATDPSGYKIKWQYYRAGRRQALAIMVTAAATFSCGACAESVWVAMAVHGAAGAAAAIINGASGDQIFRAALSSAIMAAVAHPFGKTWSWEKVVSMAVAGGMTSVLQGGKFGHGFISAGLGAMSGAPTFQGLDPLLKVGVSAVIGGTASALTGGKFANGAATAAFSAALSADWKSRDRYPATNPRYKGGGDDPELVGPGGGGSAKKGCSGQVCKGAGKLSGREKHYARNAENDAFLSEQGLYGRNDITTDELKSLNFKHVGAPEDKFHTWGAGNENNQKWVFDNGGRYGSYEIIIRPYGDNVFMHVMDANVMGTLNYGSSVWTHFWRDVVPYYRYGNSPQDTTTAWQRIGRTFE